MNAKEIHEEFKGLVRKTVAANGNTRFGEKESLDVIEGLVDILTNDEEAGNEGFDSIREHIRLVVNPSAFAQRLEKLPEGHPSRITREKGTRSKVEL